jgi:hypothetical protein
MCVMQPAYRANVARTCRALSAQQGMLLLDPSVGLGKNNALYRPEKCCHSETCGCGLVLEATRCRFVLFTFPKIREDCYAEAPGRLTELFRSFWQHNAAGETAFHTINNTLI